MLAAEQEAEAVGVRVSRWSGHFEDQPHSKCLAMGLAAGERVGLEATALYLRVYHVA